MSAIALITEKLNHHPDWSNSYNKVNIALTNHEAKSVTQLDFDLANKIDTIFKTTRQLKNKREKREIRLNNLIKTDLVQSKLS